MDQRLAALSSLAMAESGELALVKGLDQNLNGCMAVATPTLGSWRE